MESAIALARNPSFLGLQDLAAFGGSRRRRDVEVYAPASEEELIALIQEIRHRNLSFAPLGSCLSFDGQGIPHDVAVSTERMQRLELDAASQTLVVGAGVATGVAVAATLVHGLMLPVLPSCSHVTLGGSASANTYSRMTPGLGRESTSIRAVRLVTPDGVAHRCSRDENQELFYAAVGGFGLIGVITELEYELVAIGEHPAFCSSAHAFQGATGFQYLIPEHRPDGLPDGAWPGAGAVVLESRGSLRTMLTRHRYESTRSLRPTVAHQRGLLRLCLEVLVRQFPALASWFWQRNWRLGAPKRFVDEVDDATFFMDASHTLTRLLAPLGKGAPVMQQSFIIPTNARSTGSSQKTEAFVREAMEMFRSVGIHPGMFDVGFQPAAEPFVLSGHEMQDVFLVSAAFPVWKTERMSVIAGVFERLTTLCLEKYGGQLHLTKQLFCTDDVVREAYAAPIERLRSLRQQHDPNGLLKTALGARFGLT